MTSAQLGAVARSEIIKVDAIKLLLIEHNCVDVTMIRDLLNEAMPNHQFLHATNLNEGLDQLNQHIDIDIVLLDLGSLHDVGMQSVETLASNFPEVPIIVLSSNTDETQALASLSYGAQDYLVTGDFDARLLKRAIRYAQERKRSECQLRQTASFDPVTGLSNRSHFLTQLSNAIKRAERNRELLAVLFLDLDNFKNLNDSYGHAAGDALLLAVGKRLTKAVRKMDIVARLGGDEFTILLEGIKHVTAVHEVAEKVLMTMREKFDVISGVDLVVTPSIGVAIYPDAGLDSHALLQNADTAMYRAKAWGRNNVAYFDESMNADVSEAFDMECSLREVLARNELELFYQPIYDLQQDSIIAVEALVRWRRPSHKDLILPNTFLPILELTGMISRVGVWILEQACEQCHQWQQALDANLRVCVNVSPSQLKDTSFPNKVRRALVMSHLTPASLELEITEQVLMKDRQLATTVLEELKTIGVSISFDDFGSGYSSLGYLASLPFDTIKIDRGFIEKIPREKNSNLIASSIISMAQSLGRRVIAEGVENVQQLEFLAGIDCEEVQGRLFTDALPVEEFVKFFEMTKSHDLLGEILAVSE